jgi:putative oxidoreductase
MNTISNRFDRMVVPVLRRVALPALRISLGIVFLWFGALKLAGVTPVYDLIHATYSFLPTGPFVTILALWEMVIGIGLLTNKMMRTTLVLLWLQMAGTLAAPFLAPYLFIMHNNPLLLTTDGEFVVKNLVLIAASIAVGAYGTFKTKN